MATFTEYLENEGYDIFAAARKLEEEDSKNDPEEEPFRSKYKAREEYMKIRHALKDFMNESDDDLSLKFHNAVLDLLIAMNYVDTEEVSSGEEYFTSALSLIENSKYDNEIVNVYQTVLNHFGILWSGRRNYDKSLEHLKQAEALFKKYKHDVGNDPKSVDEYFRRIDPSEDIVSVSRKRRTYFEDTYTHTLFYIAQVYAMTEKKEDSAKYCHVTLQRQLDSNKYKADEWALNAATLSQYYISVDMFHFSRHCLASASIIFREVTTNEEEMTEDEKDQMMQKRADIDRCWAKYGLALMETSKDKLMKEAHETESTDHNADVDWHMSLEDDSSAEGSDPIVYDIENMKTFPRFNLEVTHVEETITDKFLRDFSEAREVFLATQKRLNDAKTYYVVDGHCSDYIQIIQDQSKAFKELIFFELDMERQCKMHKKRIDMLQETLSDLSRQHYLLVCRQLMYEIAETYSSMVDLKLAIMESEGHPTPHAVKKINALAQQSISFYSEYMESLKGGKPDFPDELSDMDVRPAMVAMFCMGRLYSKIITPDIPQRLVLMKKSCECYQFLDTYCRRNPSAEEKVTSEVSISREMIVLIPLKMEKVRDGQL